MTLPPGFLDELRARLTLSSVVGRKVVWDLRRSNQARGDWWAPCPFHQEKSPSFHVDDRKGFYYCFGCHAKGDAVTFLKETENLSFMEAVEVLAREAGLTLPDRDPRAQERADRRSQLIAAAEEAAKWFRLQLRSAAAGPARDYLARRGLSPEAQDRWSLGYAPDARQGLFQALTARGLAADLVVEAGLCARPEDGGAPYDRFRNRIVFPIRDGRGRVIGFGGRALDPAARAKYLNGPETPIFDKGRTLYNLDRAREAAGRGAPVILAEGYMDVIALAEAGFTGAVAPLGTAVTEDQLRLLWRLAPEPVVALDGDAAGLRAGLRLIDLALPLIEAGRSLRFAMLPGGQDPDELIRARGAAAMQQVLDQARPMVALLWARAIEGRVFDSPERRAALDRDLRAQLARIRDPGLRGHYEQELRRLRADLFGPARPPGAARGPGRGRAWGLPPAPASASARASALAAAPEGAEHRLIEAAIFAALVRHPGLIADFLPDLEQMTPADPDHAEIRAALMAAAAAPDRLAAPVLAALTAQAHAGIAPAVRSDDIDFARICIAADLARLTAHRGARAEIEEAIRDLDEAPDEVLTRRLSQAAAARHRADRPPTEDNPDMGEDRAALSAHLQKLIEDQIWVRKRR